MIKAIILLISAICISNINAVSTGECAKVPIIKDFDASRYLGIWYEVERSNVPFEENTICVNATYGVLNETAISVFNQAYNIKTNLPDNIEGYAWIPNSDEPNKLLVKFPNNPLPAGYNVWESDYDNYSLVYSCTQVVPRLLKFELIWILARTKTLSAQKIAEIKQVLIKNKIDIDDFEATPQTC